MPGDVFFSESMSLDGFIAPESPEELMGQQWMELQQWVFRQHFFRENLKLGKGGEEGRDNDIVREAFERTGASVMSKRMFDAGVGAWPEDPPFHTPVFVVTHEKRDPWERLGGTTFHFVNDGIESTLDQARQAAGERDVRISGGGETIVRYLNAGLDRRVPCGALARALGPGNPTVRGRQCGSSGTSPGPCRTLAEDDASPLHRASAVGAEGGNEEAGTPLLTKSPLPPPPITAAAGTLTA